MFDDRANLSDAFNKWKKQSGDKMTVLWGTLRPNHLALAVANE